jgi:hypothetical protein
MSKDHPFGYKELFSELLSIMIANDCNGIILAITLAKYTLRASVLDIDCRNRSPGATHQTRTRLYIWGVTTTAFAI